MNTDGSRRITPGEVWIVRLGGLAGLLTLSLAVLISFALTPHGLPAETGADAITAFVADHADSMGLANGLRNLGLFLIPLWAVGLYTLIARTADFAAKTWAAMGVVAFAAVMALGTVNNLLQTVAFAEFPVLTEHPELHRLLWSIAGVGFGGASRVVWAAINGSFSIAGWLSGALPRWLCIVGVLSAVSALIAVVAIAPWLAGGWPEYVDLAVFLPTGIVFPLGVGIQMLRRAAG